MNQLFDKEGAIERYLNGTMPPAEQKEFMSRMEWDADLRRSVDAELLISKAIRNDRTEIPAQPPESRARFLAMLATVAPEPASVATPESTSPGAGGSAGTETGSSFMNLLSGGSLVKGVITTLTGVAITVGAVVFMSNSSDTTEEAALKAKGTAVEMAQPATTIPQEAATSTQTPAATDPTGKREQTSRLRESSGLSRGEDAPNASAAIAQPTRPQQTPSAATTIGRSAKEATHSSSAPREQREALHTRTSSEQSLQAQQPNSTDIPVVNNDSLRIHVKPRKPLINP